MNYGYILTINNIPIRSIPLRFKKYNKKWVADGNLNSLYKYRQDDFNYIGCHNDIIRHLNSIEKMSQNILKYKTMWEELYSEREKPCGIEYMQDLELKHGIGVE